MGLSFPGGAPPGVHYLSHVLASWFPFVVAFFIAKALTRRRARFMGSVVLYLVFLLWSLMMLALAQQGGALGTVFYIGLAGTYWGGLGLCLWLVDPGQTHQGPQDEGR